MYAYVTGSSHCFVYFFTIIHFYTCGYFQFKLIQKNRRNFKTYVYNVVSNKLFKNKKDNSAITHIYIPDIFKSL